MSQWLSIRCDYLGCDNRVEIIRDPDRTLTELIRGWRCMIDPSKMNEAVDLCPEYAKLVSMGKEAA